MIVEHFKGKNAVPIYRRFRDKGRLVPEGLNYVSSWVDTNFQKCFQLIETDDEKLIKEWIANWEDIIDFEVISVRTSKEAAEKIADRL